MAQSFKSNVNGVYSCKYHVVWCPKYRRKVLTGEIAERFKVIVAEVAAELDSEILDREILDSEILDSEILELEVMPDHVYILCEVPPQEGIAKFVRKASPSSFGSARAARLGCCGRSSLP